MRKTCFFMALLACSNISCLKKKNSAQINEAWDKRNDPTLLSTTYERDFNKLPKTARLDKTPWSDTYWPSMYGGISWRWRDGEDDDFSYSLKPLYKVQAMDLEDIADLSPAEKYDIYIGDYSYPTVKNERTRTNHDAKGWEGICHGWAPAALAYDEPKSIVLTGANGIKVPFGSSDIKALLSFYKGVVGTGKAKFLGGRCNANIEDYPANANRPECKDVNAGSFHIVLTNELGINKTGFIADITRDREVWNQPVFAFASKIMGEQKPSRGAAPGTTREMLIETTLYYAVEHEPASEQISPKDSINATTYKYRVELDSASKIIGGDWYTQNRPDFLWKSLPETYTGYYSKIQKIYNASLNGADSAASGNTLCETTLPQKAKPNSYASFVLPSECTEQDFNISIEVKQGSGTGTLSKKGSGSTVEIVSNSVPTGATTSYSGKGGQYILSFFNGTSLETDYEINIISKAK